MRYKLMLFLVILPMVLAFSSLTLAADHYLVVDDKGPASDVVVLNALTAYLVQEGQSSTTYLTSEMPEASEDRITVFMYFGEAVINYPSVYESLAKDIGDYLMDNYGVEANMNLVGIDEEEGIELIKQVDPETLPEEAKGILYFTEILSSPLVIYGKDDMDAGNMLLNEDMELKADDEVSSTDILASDIYIIGGPCANEYWTLFSTETCEGWGLAEGEAIIKLIDNGTGHVILIAGTTKEDTESTVERYSDGSLDSELKGIKEAVISL